VGLFVSLLVIILVKGSMNEKSFNDYGWRIPFWISIFMVAISVVIRMRMQESPLFAKAKQEGRTSTNPLKESFGHKLNFKFVLLALFGATMGQGAVWYTGQFYALSFIQNTLNVDVAQASKIVMWALLFATPFFVFFGWLSDRMGRKWIMLGGMLIALLSYRPIYSAMYDAGSIKLKTENAGAARVVTSVAPDEKNTGDQIRTTTTQRTYTDGTTYKEVKKETLHADPSKANPDKDVKTTKSVVLDSRSFWRLIGWVFIQVIFVTMVYGPIAAFLVEMFPTRIRYTSMSLPYHIGNGIFGGLLPTIATFLATKATQANEAAAITGEPVPYAKPFLEGLWYPIILAAVCFVIGALYINGKDHRIIED
jgi:MFS family permease